MSALFDFRSFLTVVLLTICTCTYVKMRAPQLMVRLPIFLRHPPSSTESQMLIFGHPVLAGPVPQRFPWRSVEVCTVRREK